MVLSKEAKNALIEAGWYPGRKIDINEYEKILIREGYGAPAGIVRDFLTEFGGLYVKYPPYRNKFLLPKFKKECLLLKKQCPKLIRSLPAPDETLHFDVSKVFEPPYAVPPLTPEEVFEPRIGEELITIGQIFDGRFDLAISASGKFYACQWPCILFLGNDYVELLENLYQYREAPEVP